MADPLPIEPSTGWPSEAWLRLLKEKPMEQVPQVGDWVRFYRDGRLVIAEVAYVVSDPLIGRLRLNTTEGSIDADGALEVRSRV